MEGDKSISSNTRERILNAAGAVFAEYGFRCATVREICRQANVNVAAVNYHFRDKESLYIAVLKYCREQAFQKYPLDLQFDERRPPEEHLKSFIRSFLFRILEEGQPSWFWKLVAKEYIEPTSALDMLAEETIRPTFYFLSSVVKRLTGTTVSEQTVRLCCLSVVSQCLFFIYAKPMIKKLFQDVEFNQAEIEGIARHIAGFCLEAIKSLGRSPEGDKS